MTDAPGSYVTPIVEHNGIAYLSGQLPRVGGELVSVKTNKDYSAEIGQPISVTVPANACHLFDQSTGARIAA